MGGRTSVPSFPISTKVLSSLDFSRDRRIGTLRAKLNPSAFCASTSSVQRRALTLWQRRQLEKSPSLGRRALTGWRRFSFWHLGTGWSEMERTMTSPLPQPDATRALSLSTLAFTVCFAVWTIFSIIGIQINQELGLSEAEFGLLVGTPVLTGSLVRLVLGIWTDRFGGRLVYTATMIASAVATPLSRLPSFASTIRARLLGSTAWTAVSRSSATRWPACSTW